MLDYSTLKIIWWLLVGVLLVGFAIMDGHDMGVGTLLPWVGKNDLERRVIINTVGPHWDGNQVWFITAGGAIFAAWPLVYATAFSGFYWAMMLVLWALFFRPVGFDYRSKLHNPHWRRIWDWGLFVGGFVPPVIFGVAFGNLLQGVPFEFNNSLILTYEGTFWQLLNPFALLCGLVASAMITLHGGVYLMHRTEGKIYQRTSHWVTVSFVAFLLTFTLAGIWVAYGVDGYVITSIVNPGAQPDPLAKTVALAANAWFLNYQQYPLTMLVPALAYAGFCLAFVLAKSGRTFWAFWASSLGLTGVIGTAGVSMFPFVIPSSSNMASSLTVWDSASSYRTLAIMLVAVIIFMPIIVLYTRWAYSTMRGKVTAAYIQNNEHNAY